MWKILPSLIWDFSNSLTSPDLRKRFWFRERTLGTLKICKIQNQTILTPLSASMSWFVESCQFSHIWMCCVQFCTPKYVISKILSQYVVIDGIDQYAWTNFWFLFRHTNILKVRIPASNEAIVCCDVLYIETVPWMPAFHLSDSSLATSSIGWMLDATNVSQWLSAGKEYRPF